MGTPPILNFPICVRDVYVMHLHVHVRTSSNKAIDISLLTSVLHVRL